MAQLTPIAVQMETNEAHDRAMADRETLREQMQLLAHLHREAADLRLVSDPRAFECNELQANLLYLAGEPAEAIEYLTRAAAFAIANDDLIDAAFASVEAGLIAAEEGWTEQVIRFAAEVRMLSAREGLSPEDRSEILRRLQTVR